MGIPPSCSSGAAPLASCGPSRLRRGVAAALFALTLLPTAASAARRKLDLHHQSLRLPGAPASVIATDLDGDGRQDLAVFVAYTRWDQRAIEERGYMDDVEGLVEFLTIVPFVADHRELWGFLGAVEGGFRSAGPPTELPPSVLSLAAGPPGLPLVALTDDGVAAIHLDSEGPTAFRFEELIDDPPVLAGSGVFVPRLELVADATGDGIPDLLLPASDGIAVYPGTGDGLALEPTVRLSLEGNSGLRDRARLIRRYPWPQVEDVDGDALPDLLWRDPRQGWGVPRVILNQGASLFAQSVEVTLPDSSRTTDEDGEDRQEAIVFVGDLDGDGRAETVSQETIEIDDDAGMREAIAYAEAPESIVRIYSLDDRMAVAAKPTTRFETLGYAFDDGGESDSDIRLPGGFQDLNGDDRLDLVTITLQISVLKMMAGVATGRVTLPIDFHVWCQRTDGSFQPVSNLDLSGKFRIKLGDMQLRDLPMFGGDFDGDGKVDFVQVGRGRTMTIHSGRGNCSFPSEPDLRLKLRREPQDLQLLQIRDLDGDGRSDVLLIQPVEVTDDDVSPPVALDLYLSGGTE